MTARRRWLRRLAAVTLFIALLIVVLRAFALMTPVYPGPESDHFDGTHFSNTGSSINKSLFTVLRWMLTREPGAWSQRRDTVWYIPPAEVDDTLRVTFVNHATVLIQTDGLNILTDPIWSKRASPVSWMGPARFREPGIRLDDLPRIDIVLISHNHYDHMDLPTLAALAESHDPRFYVPLGNARYLNKADIDNVVELDWWQTETTGAVEIHAVPARHWSKRGLYDANRALWSGYVIMTGSGPVYFAGDTGMGTHFAEISARLGPPRLALLPIGSYLPRWFMQLQHINPAEAVTAHQLLGAVDSMGIHFGTYAMGDDGQDEAGDMLRSALLEASVPEAQFWIPGNGESRIYEKINEPFAYIAAR
ncbi:MAG: MBL fold metallo-hydrolase [Gammaproteobacteria bacterium]|nr:MBL fold metallo-hydrolase [Gammaproteobacteria bacterium]